MFLNVFHDLLKPQWIAVLRELKMSGGMAVSELSKELGSSYMTVKQHCEELTKHGYLVRSRVPRTEIGRPEIYYRLGEKSEGLLSPIPAEFTLGMLEHARQLFGEMAPEKLLFHYFQDREEVWKARVGKGTTLLYRAGLLAKVREKEGLFVKVVSDGGALALREYHHPLWHVFERFPRAVVMEQRAMEQALGCRMKRQQVSAEGNVPKYVEYILGE